MASDRPTRSYSSMPEILETLPHRPPFVFIDRVLSVDPAASLVAIKNIGTTECFGAAASKTFPPEYILEVFGQAAILLFFADNSRATDEVETLLVGIDTFRIHGRVRPGDAIKAEVCFEKKISSAGILIGEATVAGKKIASAKMSVAFVRK